MSNRIRKDEAARIAEQLMAIKMIPDARAKCAELKNDTEHRLMAYIPKEVLEFEDRFPGFVRRSTYHYVCNEMGHKNYVTLTNSTLCLPRDKDMGDYSRVSNEDFDAFEANSKQIEEINNSLRKTRQDIVNKIQGKSVKSVCETWPEACSIVRELMGDAAAQLPAVLNAELNKALGLPVDKD